MRRNLCLCVFLPLVCGGGGDQSITVKVNEGILEGNKLLSSDGNPFYSFLGVPFAKPPVGNLRFQVAQPPGEWAGVRNAKEYSPVCAQYNYVDMLVDYESSFNAIGEEDCLYLNIYSKEIQPKKLYPVMVFIHGGGFGAGGTTTYTPELLLKEGIVLVVIQYRLALLGFLWTEDSVFDSNVGLKDQVIALKWVKENIEIFGGDPNSITLFGTSAGAASIHAHLLSNYSKDLFRRAILMSGTLLCPWAKMTNPRETAMKIGENFNCFNGYENLEGSKKSQVLLSCLRNVDVVDILKVSRDLHEWSQLPKRAVPYVDGDFFPEDIEGMVTKGKVKPADVIFGINRDEGSFVSSAILTMNEQRKAIKEKFSTIGPISLALEKEKNAISLAQRVYNFYVGGINNELEDYFNLTNMYGDHHFKVCSDVAALHHSRRNAKEGRKTFFYEYDHRAKLSILDLLKNPSLSAKMVSHGDDLYNILNTEFVKNLRPQDREVAETFSRLLANFARNGNPTPDESLGFTWDEFTQNSPRHLRITANPHMEDDLREKERKFWKSLPTLHNHLMYGGEEEGIKNEL